MVIYILLLGIKLYKGAEHACDLLMVSVSMSIQNCEMIGSTPGFCRSATPGVTEFQ